ncbi:MAG: phosphatidylglycerophosphatase A [Acidobacteriota bacterium]
MKRYLQDAAAALTPLTKGCCSMLDEGKCVYLATLGGLGMCPVAPATVGTFFVGIPVVWLMGFLPLVLAALLLALIFGIGCHTAGETEKIFQRRDPQVVVIDELVGYMVTMIGLPVTGPSILIGFAAFRLFDIWKPWPIRTMLHDRLEGGFAIVADDVGAGVYAHILTWAVLKVWG